MGNKNSISSGYFYYSQNHFEFTRDLAMEMCYTHSKAFINGKPYTLLNQEKDGEYVQNYKEEWGDVILVHEGPGRITPG